jgi:hypothetical protein
MKGDDVVANVDDEAVFDEEHVVRNDVDDEELAWTVESFTQFVIRCLILRCGEWVCDCAPIVLSSSLNGLFRVLCENLKK